jgi:predicted transcriptional regulator
MASSDGDKELCDLLFELSNMDRLHLLSLIDKEPGKLSKLAQRGGTTTQETSRHLERLQNSGLLERGAFGEYRLSSIGKIALNVLPTLGFIVKNREYILDHDFSYLPNELIQRLGELTESCSKLNASDAFQHFESVVSGAKKYVWLMSDKPFLSLRSLEKMSPRSGTISWRVIVNSAMREKVERESIDLNKELWEFHFVDDAKVAIAMNETEAGVCLADAKGKLDMDRGFKGDNPEFHNWCRDLFLHYWEGRSNLETKPLNFDF